MKRQLLTAAAAVLASFLVSAAAYSDLPANHWAYGEMTRAASLRIMNGVTESLMQPNGTLTWAQYLAMAGRAFASDEYWTAYDSATAWDVAGYQTAQNNGLLWKTNDFLSVTAENMRTTPITRQDVAVLLSRALDIKRPGQTDGGSSYSGWDDGSSSSGWNSGSFSEEYWIEWMLDRIQSYDAQAMNRIRCVDPDFPDSLSGTRSGDYQLSGSGWSLSASWDQDGGVWRYAVSGGSISGRWGTPPSYRGAPSAEADVLFDAVAPVETERFSAVPEDGGADEPREPEAPRARDVLSDFYDMDGDRQEAVTRLFELGIVRGKSNGAFGPGDTIRRCDGAVLLMRTLDYIDENIRRGDATRLQIRVVEGDGTVLSDGIITDSYVGQSLYTLAYQFAPENYKARSQAGHVSSASHAYDLTVIPMSQAEIAQKNARTEAQRRYQRGEITQAEYELQDFWLKEQGDNARKRLLIYGDPNITYYETAEEAAPNMIQVEVPVWRLRGEQKVSGTMSVKVHKALAEDVEEIFTEIYHDPEQFPFSDMGGYNWGGTITTNEHRNGSAIDLNVDANFCIREGSPVAGTHWSPGEDPYSITPEGSVVRIFAEHGWSWGGSAWSGHTDQTYGYHDYMHFSYRGR